MTPAPRDSTRAPRRTGWVRLVPLLLLGLVLAACSPPAGPAAGPATPGGESGEAARPPDRTRVDVDTPALRRAKQDAGIAACPGGSGEPVRGGLPEMTLPCLGGGQEVALSGLRGPLVVNVWASWCPPCRDELPVLQRFYAAHKDQVGVLGIDYSDPRVSAAMELAVDSGVQYPLLADPQQRISGAGPFPPMRGLPFLVLVDQNGVVVHQEFTVVRDVARLESLVRTHLGVAL